MRQYRSPHSRSTCIDLLNRSLAWLPDNVDSASALGATDDYSTFVMARKNAVQTVGGRAAGRFRQLGIKPTPFIYADMSEATAGGTVIAMRQCVPYRVLLPTLAMLLVGLVALPLVALIGLRNWETVTAHPLQYWSFALTAGLFMYIGSGLLKRMRDESDDYLFQLAASILNASEM